MYSENAFGEKKEGRWDTHETIYDSVLYPESQYCFEMIRIRSWYVSRYVLRINNSHISVTENRFPEQQANTAVVKHRNTLPQ